MNPILHNDFKHVRFDEKGERNVVCKQCNKPIKDPPFVSKLTTNSRTGYYHFQCAQKVGLI